MGYTAQVLCGRTGLPDGVGKERAYDAQGGGSVSLPRQYRRTTVGARGRDGISQMAKGIPRVSVGGTERGIGVSCGAVVRRGLAGSRGNTARRATLTIALTHRSGLAM